MKPIYKSRTFWANVIGLIVLALEAIREPTLIVYTSEGLVVANLVLVWVRQNADALGLEP